MSVGGGRVRTGRVTCGAAGDFCTEQEMDVACATGCRTPGGGGERPCGSRQAVAIRPARTTLAVRCRAIDPGQNSCWLGAVIAVRAAVRVAVMLMLIVVVMILGYCGDFWLTAEKGAHRINDREDGRR